MTVDLSFANVNRSGLPMGGEACIANGFHWSLREKWTLSGLDNAGGNTCSLDVTGKHFDPSLACGPFSANPLCKSSGSPGNYPFQLFQKKGIRKYLIS